MIQRPEAVGMVLCEQLIVEEGTRYVTLVNCFRHRVADEFPCCLPLFLVVAWLTEGKGDVILKLTVQEAGTLDEIHTQQQIVHFDTPLQEFRFVARLSKLEWPSAGRYVVALEADGDLLVQKKFSISLP